jgi:hypothetical protein
MAHTMRCCVAVTILLLVVSAEASDFVHPRLKAREVTIRSVVVLPAHVVMSKHGVKGTETMGQEADEAAAELVFEVTVALTNRGLLVEKPFTEEALKDNDELKTAMADVQQRFDEIERQLFRKEKDIRKGRFTLGDSVAILNTKGTTDAIVIVRSEGNKETKGKAFMNGGGLLGMALAGEATFRSRVALVDAKNGDILFMGDYLTRGLPKDKTYEKSFKSIPFAK